MNLRRLVAFIRGDSSAEDFLGEINPEVVNYRDGLRKQGSSVPIYVTEDDFRGVIDRADMKRLCGFYLGGILDEWHLQYICNVIELAPSLAIEDEEVDDAIFRLANPEINFPVTPEMVRGICGGL